MNIPFTAKRDAALTLFALAAVASFTVPVYRRSLLLFVASVGVLSVFLVDKWYEAREVERNGEESI